ncbi:DUF2778 domain-containing protein [Sulfurospirillum deleyianum]|uniref:DUF2778 domain-containing protein n=1 Tax=Sulfurospirillum deleyianum TaxID=65553 RepID=UPI0005A05A25|nr:DUF2778 domain-containing protein [Sulfurospirillum deleyianum]
METGKAYMNDFYNNSNADLLTTAGTETQRAIDAQEGSKFDQSKEYRDARSEYSQNFGSNIASYADFALYFTGQGSLSTGSNSISTSSQTLANNAEFAGLNKELGDNSINKIDVLIKAFDGKTRFGTAYFYIDGEQQPRVVRVTSGNENPDPKQKDKGPTPAGTYTIDPAKAQNMSLIDRILGRDQGANEMSNVNLFLKKGPNIISSYGDWGDFRVILEPITTTDTFGRTQMYLHGGEKDGSAGCIDCGETPNQWILKEIRDTTIQIPVEIKYDK